MEVLARGAHPFDILQSVFLGEAVGASSGQCQSSFSVPGRPKRSVSLFARSGAAQPIGAAAQPWAGSPQKNSSVTESASGANERKGPAPTWDIYGRRIKQKQRRGRGRGGGEGEGAEGSDSGSGPSAREGSWAGQRGSGRGSGAPDGRSGRSGEGFRGNGAGGLRRGRSGDGRDRQQQGWRRSGRGEGAVEVAIDSLVSAVRQARNEEEVQGVLQQMGPPIGNAFQTWYRILDRIFKDRPSQARSMPAEAGEGRDRPHLEGGGSWPLILQIFRFLQQQPWYEPSPFWYAKLIALAGRSRRPDQAWALLLEMQRCECSPTPAVCNALIRSFLVAGMEAEAEEVLAKMRDSPDCRPNTRTLNMFVYASCRDGRVAAAEERVAELRGSGLLPDEFTYSALLYGYTRACQVDQLEATLRAMRREGCVLGRPDVATSIIACFSQAGRWEALDELAHYMTKGVVQSSVDTWNALIDAYAAVGKVERMASAYRGMRLAHFGAGPATYVSLLNGYRLASHPKHIPEVTRLLEEVAEQNFPPSAELAGVYTAAIDAYGSLGACDLMAEIFSVMLDCGCEPDRKTLRALVAGFGEAGLVSEMETVFEMLKDLVKPDKSVAEAMISAYSKVGDEWKVEEMRQNRGMFVSSKKKTRRKVEDEEGPPNEPVGRGVGGDLGSNSDATWL